MHQELIKLAHLVRPITIVESGRLSRMLGVKLTIASETLQTTGSVKFRGACNVVESSSAELFVTVSSGNFGRALAYACNRLNRSCIVVMPHSSSRRKIEATRDEGAIVEFASSAAEQTALIGALSSNRSSVHVINAKEDPVAIAGYTSLGVELGALDRSFDLVVAPVGGGGVISGIIKGLRKSGRTSKVVGAEPLLANDAALSFRQGRLIRLKSEPQTIADGARALSLGTHCWEVIRNGLSDLVEVSEEAIKEGVRILFTHLNLKAEPTGALAVGAVLAYPALFRGRSVCCLVTGGNVDSDVFARILMNIA
jgi:threonine dehydratase